MGDIIRNYVEINVVAGSGQIMWYLCGIYVELCGIMWNYVVYVELCGVMWNYVDHINSPPLMPPPAALVLSC